MQKENLFTEAQNLIKEFIEQKDISKSKLSKKVGVNAAVITFISNNQIEMVSDEMLLKVINTLKSKSSFNTLGTSNYNTIFNICKDATKHHKLTGIIGYTGAGKSTALYDYYRSTKNVFYVECKNSMNRKQFLHEVLAELGVNFLGSVYDMVKLIIDELNSKENPLLIIDEAGKLSTTLILDLHDLRNATINNAAIIMAGCEYFQKNLLKAVTKDKTGYPEFYSRVVNWNILNRPTKVEIAAICQSNGVSDEDTIKEFFKLNNYRLLHNAIMNERGQL
jgi:DNA transposition AAA+ family ATPase